jgi:hypothetical protein
VRTIPLHGAKAAGRVALVDDDDYDLVMQYRWHVWERTRSSGGTCGPYAATNIHRGGRHWMRRMHQIVTGWPMTDHINHNTLDNQRANLRPATLSQNGANQLPNRGGSSRFKGVSWQPERRKWAAYITVNQHRVVLGRFRSEEDAARAYDAAALSAWGEYAHLNLPAA